MVGAIIGTSSVLIAVITLVKLLVFYKKHHNNEMLPASGSSNSRMNTSMSMMSNSSTTTRILADSSISLHSLQASRTTSPSNGRTLHQITSSLANSNSLSKLRSNHKQQQSSSSSCNQM